MSVALPIITRAIWIDDPSFTYPIAATGQYWKPSSTAASSIGESGTIQYRAADAHVPNTSGRYISILMDDNAGAFGDTWELESALSPYGVAAGPHDVAALAAIRFRPYVIAKCSGNWSSGSALMQAIVSGYETATSGTNSTAAITLTSAADAGLAYTDTTWTLFTGSATMVTDTDTRHYTLKLRFKDGAGTAGRYIDVAWAGLAVPFAADTPYEDRLTSWYDAAPQMTVGQHSIQGRPALQQVVTLNWSQLSDADIALLRKCAQWNLRTPTDDVTKDIVNRGNASPVIVSMDRGDVKRAFYADMGGTLGLGVATGGGQMWLESGNLFSTSTTFTERLYL